MMQNFDLYEDDIAANTAAGNTLPITCDNYFAIGLDLNRDDTIDTGNASTATKNSPQPLSPAVIIFTGDITAEAQVSFYIAGSVIGL